MIGNLSANFFINIDGMIANLLPQNLNFYEFLLFSLYYSWLLFITFIVVDVQDWQEKE